MIRATAFLLVLTVAASSAAPALAQPLTREELETALRQRDQQIADLERRLAAVEAGRGATTAVVRTPPQPTAAASAAQPAVDASDDEGALQALSRGLVERGVLLLGTGKAEISPGLTYSHTQKQGLVLVDTPEGISTVSDQRQRDDGLQGQVTARLGLPWRSQLEVRVPFGWKREDSALGDGTEVIHDDTHLGDIELELSHQFLVEQGWRPDLIGAVSLRFPTGRDPFAAAAASVANGGATYQLTGRLTAVKTIDPIVLFTTLSYSSSFSRRETFGRVRPGDAIDLQLGALLAVSPETSLSVGFAQQFRGRTSVDGRSIAGSDGVAAVAQFGVDQVLSPRAALDVSLGVGVTRDAPDYALTVSLPIRF